MTQKTVRFAVLGAGRIGQVHARAITSVPAAVLVAIADPFEAAAQAAQDQFGCDIRSIDMILQSDDVDAVVICTPTDTHADLIERAVHAGKAVFCEKPIDLDVARVRECLQTVDSCKGQLMVGFQRRFDPDFRALKHQIDQGTIGAVEMISLTSRDPAPPPADYIKRSGGIFRDMAIHDLDVARWLLDEEVATVQASGSVLVDNSIAELGDFDSASIILTTATGKQCTISVSRRASYGYDQRIEVHGSLGAVTATNHHMSRTEVATQSGYTRPPLQDFFMTRYQAAYAAEIAHFVDCLVTEKPLSPTGRDGLMALLLAEAATRSVSTGERVEIGSV